MTSGDLFFVTHTYLNERIILAKLKPNWISAKNKNLVA